MIRTISLISIVIISLSGMVFASFWPESWPSVVAFITPTVVGLFVLVQVQESKQEVKAYHMEVNSKMDRYMELVAKASRAEGVKEQRESAERAAQQVLDANGGDHD